MKFKLTNTTGETLTVNNAAKSPEVKLVMEKGKVKPEVTFLSNDFMTYQGNIEAGKSVEMILLFELSEKAANEISAPELQISVGTSTKNIKL